jgi:hypothetical protein
MNRQDLRGISHRFLTQEYTRIELDDPMQCDLN